MSNSNHTTVSEGARIRGLSFIEGRPSTVRCVSIGGYPPPDMDVQLGSHKLTSEFNVRHSATLRGSPGLRQMVYRTERWTYSFLAEARDDGDSLSCTVMVPGLKSNTSYVDMHVRCKPEGVKHTAPPHYTISLFELTEKIVETTSIFMCAS